MGKGREENQMQQPGGLKGLGIQNSWIIREGQLGKGQPSPWAKEVQGERPRPPQIQ